MHSNSSGGKHGTNNPNSHGANNNNGSSNHGHVNNRRYSNSRGGGGFQQQQAYNFMLQQQQQQAMQYYLANGYPQPAYGYGYSYPNYQGQNYNNVPFNNQGGQGSYQSGPYYQNNFNRNQNKNLGNKGHTSANSSPVAHKNNLNGFNNSGPVPGISASGSPALPAAGVLNSVRSPNPATSATSSPSKSPYAVLNSPLVATAGTTPGSKITIKNPKGEDVNLNALASKSQTPSTTTTPKLNNNVKLTPVSATISSAASSPAKTKVESSAINEFKAKIAAAAKAKKEQADKLAKAAAEKEKNASDNKKEVTKPVEKEPETKPAEKEPEAVAIPEKTSEQEGEKPEPQEGVKESQAPVDTETEKVYEQTETPKTEEKASEEPASEQPKPIEESQEEPATLPKKPSASIVETEVTPEVPAEDDVTITQLFDRLKTATPIENPFDFKYPEGFQSPDAKFKPVYEKTKKIKYDPVFLLQFQKPLQLTVDKEWKEKHGSLVSVADHASHGGNMRSASNFRSSLGGFGTGSNIGGARGSPMMNNLRSASNLRKGFGGDAKSGSRQNSKRGGRSGGSRRGGDERSGSKRSNSKRYNKDNEDKVRETISNIENQIKNNEKQQDKPAEPVKPLEKSANRWVPRSLKKAAAGAEIKKNPDGSEYFEQEDIKRKSKSLLNKLTLEMFEPITDELIKLAEQSKWEEDAKSLKLVLEMTFAKATDEPHWSSMYAQFCAKMMKTISPEVTDKTIINKKTTLPESGGGLVRKCLLTTCQVEYEKGWSDKLPTNPDGTPLEPEMMSDEYYKAAAAKRRGLGLVRFIGELYALGLLSDNVIFLCLMGQSSNVTDPSEDSLETLSQLVRTVGLPMSQSPNPKCRGALEEIFRRINTIVTLQIPSRIKFKLMDLIDLKKHNWVDADATAGPKTIAQIHQEAERARLLEERSNAEKRNKRYHGGDSRQNSNWEHNRLSKSDVKNIGVIRNSSEKSLGPMNFGKSKSRQSSSNLMSNTRENSRRTPSNPVTPSSSASGNQDEKSSSQLNMFSVLGGDHEEHEEHDESEESEGEAQHENGKQATPSVEAVKPEEGTTDKEEGAKVDEDVKVDA